MERQRQREVAAAAAVAAVEEEQQQTQGTRTVEGRHRRKIGQVFLLYIETWYSPKRKYFSAPASSHNFNSDVML